jgi:hypothetical protein
MKIESNSFTTASLSTVKERHSAYAGDIRQPWQSVYGFPTLAARLATERELLLSCREDETFGLLAKLNDLLQDPTSLNRAYQMLQELEQVQRQKLAGLIQKRDQSIAESEIPGLLTQVEQLMAKAGQKTKPERLAELLSSDSPLGEMAGLQHLLQRLQPLLAALAEVKDQGFRVVVSDRRRQAARPGLEARRNQPVVFEGQPVALPAGFLLPARYHLTLWNYLVVRGDTAQSAVWN